MRSAWSQVSRSLWFIHLPSSPLRVQACSPTPCSTSTPIPSVEFDGRRYDIAYASDLQIRSSDLMAIGELGEAFPLADGLGVFALEGVDPRRVIVMRAPPAKESTTSSGTREGPFPRRSLTRLKSRPLPES